MVGLYTPGDALPLAHHFRPASCGAFYSGDSVITVQLDPNGPITLMDEAGLIRIDGEKEDANEKTTWVEYRLPSDYRIVHRSVHVTLKKGQEHQFTQGLFGG